MNEMLGAPYSYVKHEQHFLSHSIGMSLQERINELFNHYVEYVDPEFNKAAFARAVGVSRPTVTDWMNGTTKTINGEKAHAVAKLFNANAEYVQTGKGEKYKKRRLDNAQADIQKVIDMATASINARMPAMSREDRIKAISLCLMHYSLNSSVPDDELQTMIDRALPM